MNMNGEEARGVDFNGCKLLKTFPYVHMVRPSQEMQHMLMSTMSASANISPSKCR